MLSAIFGIIILFAFCATLCSAVPSKHRAIRAMGCFGFFAFLFKLIVPPLGNHALTYIELPAYFRTITIVSPSGAKYSAINDLSRIQKYDADSKFERGWFPSTGTGLFQIGLTRDGKIVAASARPKHVEIFSAEGIGKAELIKVKNFDNISLFEPLGPKNNPIRDLDLIDPVIVKNPNPNIQTIILFPISSPFVGWLFIVAAAFLGWMMGVKFKSVS